ncbi:kinase-like protein [Massarina eburnea CBS 473.64]|uniref:Kinase-like protein n=1 Tax=Massarina eburnea CBS 473.64 TaxID=1395130 RepID=A0A6A6S178_9PLEO|nr:kinase-like protein [Massarina eburnea CBS 473.64]
MVNQEGLEWKYQHLSLEPCWTKEPDTTIITRLAREHLGPFLKNDAIPLEVTFFDCGAFNKLYKITAPGLDKTYLMRVSLPVDPHHKVSSEVATIKFLEEETHIPVPKIVASNDDNGNELGFEWILMEMCEGGPLRKCWRKLEWQQKEEIVRKLARYQAELFDKPFERIGNIYSTPSGTTPSGTTPSGTPQAASQKASFTVSRIVSMSFFWGSRINHDVLRGPFTTSSEWLRSRLQLFSLEHEHLLKNSDDEDEILDAEDNKKVAECILEALPVVFPPDATQAETTVLFHDDLSSSNILVNEKGELMAIIDWEFVSTLPLWRACQFPYILQGRTREEKPIKDIYASDDESDSWDDDPLDNEGVAELYWEHLMEYEKGQLRAVFLEEMKKLQPEWVQIMEESSLKADFERAVNLVDSDWMQGCARRWANAVKEGKPYSLLDIIEERVEKR